MVLDGKTERATLQHLAEDQRPMHHLNVFEVKTGIGAPEARVAEKANELCGLTSADFPTRKVEALLVYLACTGRTYPREQLAELLWDDRAQAQSLTNLRATLPRLNELDPLREETHRHMMILLAWSGQRSAALAQ